MTQFRLPLVPGPVTVPAAVLAARERDYPSPDLEDEFFALYGRVQRQLETIMGTAHPPAILLGEAMAVLWGAMKSCVAPGDRGRAVPRHTLPALDRRDPGDEGGCALAAVRQASLRVLEERAQRS